MSNEQKAKEILAKIEVLDVAANLIFCYGDSGEEWSSQIDNEAHAYQKKLADQLWGRAERLRKKYNIQ